MAITNTSKPSAPNFTNLTRVVSYETWNTITTTWATETKTWDDMQSTMDNLSKVSSSITNVAKP